MAKKRKKATPITREIVAKVKELDENNPNLSMKVIAEVCDISVPSLRTIRKNDYDYDSYRRYVTERFTKNGGKKSSNGHTLSRKVNQNICDAAKALYEAGTSVSSISKYLNLGRSTVNFIKQANWSSEGYRDYMNKLAERKRERKLKKQLKTESKNSLNSKVWEVGEKPVSSEVVNETATLAKEFDRAVNLTVVMIEEMKKSNQMHQEIKEMLKEMAFHIQQLYTFEHNKQEYRNTRWFSKRK